MTVKLTQAEADDLWEFYEDEDYETFELAPARNGKPAKVVRLRGATVAEYVKYVVRRVPSVEASYVEAIRVGGAEAKAAEDAKAAAAKEPEEVPFGTRRAAPVAEPAAKPDAAEAEPKDEDKPDPVTLAMMLVAKGNAAEGAIEERAALIAVCVGKPGDEAFEREIVSHPRFYALSDRADFKTKGADPFAFSADVTSALLVGLPRAPEPAEGEAQPTAA